MASLANKDEAEKCRDMAKTFLSRGEHEKAVRFLEKSLRLFPLPGVESMRDLAKVRLIRPAVTFFFSFPDFFSHSSLVEESMPE